MLLAISKPVNLSSKLNPDTSYHSPFKILTKIATVDDNQENGLGYFIHGYDLIEETEGKRGSLGQEMHGDQSILHCRKGVCCWSYCGRRGEAREGYI